MTEQRWFVPELDDPADMTEREHAFAAALSRATAHLAPERGVSDVLIPAEYADFDDGSLVAALTLADPGAEPRQSVLEFGVEYRKDGSVAGGRLHSQLHHITGETPSLAFEAADDLEALAQSTATWFAEVLRRPVVLYVWLHDGWAYAARYAFADTSETLVQSYSRNRAPQGQYEAVIAAGHVRGKGWLQTAGLPTPDLYLAIRGDMASARIPAGVRAENRRGPLPGLWYE